MSKRLILSIIALACCFTVIVCSTAKAPAEAAIKAAEEPLTGVKSDASVYVPDQLKGVEDALASAKETFKRAIINRRSPERRTLPAKQRILPRRSLPKRTS